MRRITLVFFSGSVALWSQSSPPATLSALLNLSPAQVAQIQQLNADLNTLVTADNSRESVLQQQISAEYAKPSPDSGAVGQRYLQIASLDREIAAARMTTINKVDALLTAAQTGVLQQLANAQVQGALVTDASCSYLAPALPTAARRLGNFVGGLTVGFATGASLNLPGTIAFGCFVTFTCSSAVPLTIRSYLDLTDTQVSGILGVIAAYQAFDTRKQNRVADVQEEIRQETANRCRIRWL